MPKKLERSLMRRATDMGLTGDRLGAYVYGTMRKTGWKPTREMQDGGLVKAAEEQDRISAVRNHAEGEFWNEMVPQMDVLGAKIVKDYGWRPPVVSDGKEFARRVYENSLINGQSPYGVKSAKELEPTDAEYGLADPHTAMRGGPSVWFNLSRARPFGQQRETYNHEFRHLALSPVSHRFGRENRVVPDPLEHLVIAAMSRQLADNKTDKERAETYLENYKAILNDAGKDLSVPYIRMARRYIDALQKGEPADIGYMYRNMPYRRVDMDMMEKDASRGMPRKFARGGIASIAKGFSGGNSYGIGALVPWRTKMPPLPTVKKGKGK